MMFSTPPKFSLHSWTGRLLIINTMVYVAMALQAQTIGSPSQDILLLYGAKDNALILAGEYWRLFTPMFVHIGILHFGLNMLALRVIGHHIESMLGSKIFITIYMLSGVFSIAASTMTNIALSAGASGAIFGLLGSGGVFEALFARKLRQQAGVTLSSRPYRSMILINLTLGFALGFLSIGIDNAAHIAGLIFGIILSIITISVKRKKYLITSIGIVLILYLMSYVGYKAVSPAHQMQLVNDQISSSKNLQNTFYILSKAIEMFPQNDQYYFERGSLLLFSENLQDAFEDFNKIQHKNLYKENFLALLNHLHRAGKMNTANQLEKYILTELP